MGNGDDAVTLFTSLVLGAVISDGKPAQQEFGLIKPLLEEAIGEELTYEDAPEFMASFKSGRSEYKKMIASLTGMFGAVSEELKTDIVLLCLLVCASDGKISKRKKNRLAQLVG